MPPFLVILISCTSEETPTTTTPPPEKKPQPVLSAPASTDKNAASMLIKIDQNAKYDEEGKPRGEQEGIGEEELEPPSLFSYAIEVQKTEVSH